MIPPRRHSAAAPAVALLLLVLAAGTWGGEAARADAGRAWRDVLRRAVAASDEGRLDEADAEFARLRELTAGASPAARAAARPWLAYNEGLLHARRGDATAAEASFADALANPTDDPRLARRAAANLAATRLRQADAPLAQALPRLEELAALLESEAATRSPEDAARLARLVAEDEPTRHLFDTAAERAAASMEAARAGWDDAEPGDARARLERALLRRREALGAATRWRELVEKAREQLRDQEPAPGDQQQGERPPQEGERQPEAAQEQQGDAGSPGGDQTDAGRQEGDSAAPDGEGEAREHDPADTPPDAAPRPTPAPGTEQDGRSPRPSDVPPPSPEDDIEPIDRRPDDLPDATPAPAPTPTPAPPQPGDATDSVGERRDEEAAMGDAPEAARTDAAERAAGAPGEPGEGDGRAVVFGMTPEDARSVLATFDDSAEARYRVRFLRSHRLTTPPPAGGAAEEKAW